jgi:hypothetical protein
VIDAESEPVPSATGVPVPDEGTDGNATAAGADGTPTAPAGSDEADAGVSPQPASEVPAPDQGAADAAAGETAPPASGAYTGTRGTKPLTKAQNDKLNVLYGKLRQVPVDNEGHPVGNPRVTIGGLYAWAARERNIDVEQMIDLMNDQIARANAELEPGATPETMARDESGRLHFGPLRDRLSRAEASSMIDGMEKLDQEGTT